MDKVMCPHCTKELSSKRNRRLHLNVCKRNPQRHHITFRCQTCPTWRGYSEQARTEHLKSKLHRASTALSAPFSATLPFPSPVAPSPLTRADFSASASEYIPRPFNYLDVVLAPPLPSDDDNDDDNDACPPASATDAATNPATNAAHWLLTLSNTSASATNAHL
jgi:hypothetical protein